MFWTIPGFAPGRRNRVMVTTYGSCSSLDERMSNSTASASSPGVVMRPVGSLPFDKLLWAAALSRLGTSRGIEGESGFEGGTGDPGMAATGCVTAGVVMAVYSWAVAPN